MVNLSVEFKKRNGSSDRLLFQTQYQHLLKWFINLKLALFYDIQTRFLRQSIRTSFNYINAWKRKGHLFHRYQVLTKHFWFDLVYACVSCLLHTIIIVRYMIHIRNTQSTIDFDAATVMFLFVLFVFLPICGFAAYVVIPINNLQSILTNVHPLLYHQIKQKYLHIPHTNPDQLAINENPKDWIQKNIFDDTIGVKMLHFQLFCNTSRFFRDLCDQCGYKYLPDVVVDMIIQYSKYCDDEFMEQRFPSNLRVPSEFVNSSLQDDTVLAIV